MSGVEVTDLTVSYGSTVAVDSLSLSVTAGEVLAIVGPSGCGKSSLLRCIAGLEPAEAGSVRWNGADLGSTPAHERGFGLMFQHHALFPHRSVADNIAFGLRMQGSARAEQRARVEELLRLVDLVGYGDRAPDTLSGGEAQRVALARSLAPAPRLLLLDEPLGSLDRQLRDDLTGQLRTVLSDVDQTAIHVTHDLDEAYAIADRIAVMAHGRLLRIGTPQEIWRDPRSEFVARFLGHTAITERGGQRVVLRADGIRVAEGGEPATVESVVFRGALSMVDARLDRDGTPITFPASTELRPGDRITVEIAPSAIVPLDDRG